MGRRRIEHNGKPLPSCTRAGGTKRSMRSARIAAGELGSLTIDDFDPVEEAPDEDPDDRLFAAGFLMVDLEV